MSHPTKKGITIIRRMLKVDRRAEEDSQRHKQSLPCKLYFGESIVAKYLCMDFQRAVNRGAKVPDDLMGT